MLKQPDLLTPLLVVQSYAVLSALYAEQHVKLSECAAQLARMESEMVLNEMTSAAAKQIARGSNVGQEAIRIKADLEGLEQMINSLKKIQAYYTEESRNSY